MVDINALDDPKGIVGKLTSAGEQKSQLFRQSKSTILLM